jgi:two-component system, cell cycle sensor histidine kinase and response regulator CckA
MDDVQKTKEQLSGELAELRRRISELETAAEDRDQVEVLRETLHSKDFLNSLINGIADPIFVKDEKHRWIVLNDSLCEMLGHTRDEMIGKSDFDLFPKEQAEVFWAHDDTTLASDEMDVNEEEITGADGIRMISTVKTSFVNPVTGRRNIVGTIRDITDRKRTEKALLESEAKFKTISSQSMMGILILQDERFIYVNDQAAAIMEVPVEQIEGWAPGQYAALIHPEDRVFVMEQGRKKQEGEKGAVTGYSWRMITPEGNLKWIEMWSESTPYKGRTADLVTIVDISEKKTLENQLLQSQKMEAVGLLAGGIAHDFNNLLTVINSYAAFTIDSVETANPIHADLREILKAGERAALLTRQLLAFSRRQMLQPEVLDINLVVSRLEKMLSRILGEDIDMVVELASDLGRVEADPGQIEQVIMNLAVNARDAMPQGGKLSIETSDVYLDEEYAHKHVSVKPGPYVRLSVSDNGHGMDAATRERFFEPFFTTKEKGKGTGLGLSTVYGIIKQSGGNIWVYSEIDKGTTVKIYLPRVDAPVVMQRRPVTGTTFSGKETLLVVEDEDAVREVTRRILAAASYTVLTAAGGKEALEICEQHQGTIHLVLTDVVMPEMSGRTFAERLAVLCPGIKVLYMSGYTDNAIVHHGVLASGTNFISKPFSATGLTLKVREVLDSE